MALRRHGASQLGLRTHSLNLTEPQLTAIRDIDQDAMRRSKEAEHSLWQPQYRQIPIKNYMPR